VVAVEAYASRGSGVVLESSVAASKTEGVALAIVYGEIFINSFCQRLQNMAWHISFFQNT
jgi:hypothetical protein